MNTEPNKLIPLETLLPAERPSLLEQIETFVTEMGELLAKSEQLIPQAEEFEVTDEVSFQFSDDMRVECQSEGELIDKRRLNLTRPIDDIKGFVVSQAKPVVSNYDRASKIYGDKAMAYRRAEREKAEAARREAERIQRETQARLEAEARKKEQAAAQLKTESARKRAQEDADALRLAAQTTITQFVESAPPQTSSSNVQAIWLWEVADKKVFLHWLADNPMEWSAIDFKKRPMDTLVARAGKSGQEIPGLTIQSDEKFVKKAHRG